MSLAKPARGGSQRHIEPTVEMELLIDKVTHYLKQTKSLFCVFDLHAYNNKDVGKAVHGKSLYKLLEFSKVLLSVSPLGVIPYSQLKNLSSCLTHRFAVLLLILAHIATRVFCRERESRGWGLRWRGIAKHKSVVRILFKDLQRDFPDAFPKELQLHGSNGPETLADRVRVILNHWRRLGSGHPTWYRWNQCKKDMIYVEVDALWEVVKGIHDARRDARPNTGVEVDALCMPVVPHVGLLSTSAKGRHLVKNDSNDSSVSCDSMGLPKIPDAGMSYALPKKQLAILKKIEDDKIAEAKKIADAGIATPSKRSAHKTVASPLKTGGAKKAGSPKKTGSPKKIAYPKMKAASPTKENGGPKIIGKNGRTGDFVIEQATLYTTFATAQSYITCFKKKRLIITCTQKQTDEHKKVIQVLLKKCYKPGVRKSEIVNARDEMCNPRG
jgi:hypothetical protein